MSANKRKKIMPISKNALVFIWTGKEIKEEIVVEIGNLLVSSGVCIPELMKAITYDQQGICNALIKDTIENTESQEEDLNPVKQAVIYIGERFKSSLSNISRINFILELSNAIREAQDKLSFNILSAHKEEKALLNAIDIISKRSGEIQNELAEKYNITPEVVDIIKQINKTV